MTASDVEDLRRRFCTIHARTAPPSGCEACRRLTAIGVLVQSIAASSLIWGRPAALDALDALASLLTERAQLVRAHRRERNEDARDAQRDARSAYDQGLDEGRGRDGW